ncbi:MAG: sigma-70 family RNA polymerase sigma factor [Planctomycetes bacterium]|nr:sigma-70 family RNA polymerase sigma factor [Planctomycetota bacterium]
MNDHMKYSDLVGLIAESQARLYAYITSLLPDPDHAHDVLQNTNRVLWEKAEWYDRNVPFMTWACGLARNQVRAFLRDRKRDRHVFSDDVADLIATEAERQHDRADHRLAALHQCLDKLPAPQRQMLRDRYGPEGSVAQMAAQRGRPAASISMTLGRIRRRLAECVRRHLTEVDHG